MYLVPADHYHTGRSHRKRNKKRTKHHPYEEWVKMRHKIREADIRRKTRTKAISDFLRRLMPERALPSPSPETELSRKELIVPKVEAKTPRPTSTLPSTSNPKRGYDDDITEEVGAQTEEEEGEEEETVANPPRLFLDKQYSIHDKGEKLIIGDSPVFIDTDDMVTIKGKAFRGTEGLWEILTRKSPNTQLVGKEDLRKCKKILILINAHLTRYQHRDNINKTRGKKFRHVIEPLFAKPKRRGVESAIRRKWVRY